MQAIRVPPLSTSGCRCLQRATSPFNESALRAIAKYWLRTPLFGCTTCAWLLTQNCPATTEATGCDARCQVRPVLSYQQVLTIEQEVINVVNHALGAVVRILPLPLCAIRLLQRNPLAVKADSEVSERDPCPILRKNPVGDGGGRAADLSSRPPVPESRGGLVSAKLSS